MFYKLNKSKNKNIKTTGPVTSGSSHPNVNNTNHVMQALSGNTSIYGRSPISLEYLTSLVTGMTCDFNL